jgi:fibro-slime domain-containing protein
MLRRFERLRRRPLRLLLASALGWALLSAGRPALHAGNGLVALHFTNPTWDGRPARTGVDATPSAPGASWPWIDAPPEQFSVRWQGFLTVERSDLYTFSTTSDDGSWLYIDEQLVVDNGGEHGSATKSGRLHLTRGSHSVRLDYVQYQGSSELSWSWARAGGRVQTVPSWALSQDRPPYRVVVAARIVDGGIRGFALLTGLVAAWYLYTRLREQRELVGRVVAPWRHGTTLRRHITSVLAPAVALIVTLFLPWPGGPGSFLSSIEATVRDLNGTVTGILTGGFQTFQANLDTPQAGEQQALPLEVLEMLTMLRDHGVERYQISNALAANAWVLQQIVASAWPRRLDTQAQARFIRIAEPLAPDCTPIDKRTVVSLVHCP